MAWVSPCKLLQLIIILSMSRRIALFPVLLSTLFPLLQAEQVQVAVLPAKIVPEQATSLSLENGIITRLADSSMRQEAGAVIAVLNEERTAQEREEMELKVAREEIRLSDELRKLANQRSKVEFFLKLSPRERQYANKLNPAGDDMPPTPESLNDIDKRISLLQREMESKPRLMRQDFERSHAKLTLKMPFAGRLQYNFSLPKDTSGPFEFHNLPGRTFASVCDDSAFYITLSLSNAELTQLPEENFSVCISLPEGRKLTGQYARRSVERNSTGAGDMLVYYFKVPQADNEVAYSMLGSNAKARLLYEAGDQAQYVSKLELIAHPEAANCENWEQLVEKLYPDHNLILIGERNIVIRPRTN